MADESTLEAQREQLAADLATIKRSVEAGEGRFGQLDAAVRDLDAAMTEIKRTQAAIEAGAAPSGTSTELSAYVARSAPKAEHADRYLGAESAVRITGHMERTFNDQTGDYDEIWRWGLLDDPEPRTEAQRRLQNVVTMRNLARMHAHPSRRRSPSADAAVLDAARACGDVVERIFADSAGIGAEWIPDTTLPELERQVLVPLNFTSLFPRRIVPPGGDIVIPFDQGDLVAYNRAIPTTNDPAAAALSNVSTATNSFDTSHLVVASQADRDASADAIFAYAPLLVTKLAEAMQFGEDNGVVNGDAAATHQDAIASWNVRGRMGSGTSHLGGATDQRSRYTGLRAHAFDLNAVSGTTAATDQGSAQTYAGFLAAVGNLGARNGIGALEAQHGLLFCVSWEYFIQKLMLWDEFLSFDKVGALASVLTGTVGGTGTGGRLPGQVGYLAGMVPVVVGYPLTSDLAASGLYTGSGAKSSALLVNRDRFEHVVRQGQMVESDVDIRNHTTTYVARMRSTFRPIESVANHTAGEPAVHLSYNLL